MGYDEKSEAGERQLEVTLGVLNAIEGNAAVTQRTLARNLGVALGIANATLRRCVEKGLVKVREAPARRYAYYLTPIGFAEKGRLTARYLANSFRFFSIARSECEALFQTCAERGWTKLLLAGSGDLAELARLCAWEMDVEIIAVVDAQREHRQDGKPRFYQSLEDVPAGTYDAILVMDAVAPQAIFDTIRKTMAARGLAPGRVLVPRLLNVSQTDRGDP